MAGPPGCVLVTMDFLIQLVEDYVATDRSHAKI